MRTGIERERPHVVLPRNKWTKKRISSVQTSVNQRSAFNSWSALTVWGTHTAVTALQYLLGPIRVPPARPRFCLLVERKMGCGVAAVAAAAATLENQNKMISARHPHASPLSLLMPQKQQEAVKRGMQHRVWYVKYGRKKTDRMLIRSKENGLKLCYVLWRKDMHGPVTHTYRANM